jgi:RNA polymerase sigma-70 factor (ECF subfamily)
MDPYKKLSDEELVKRQIETGNSIYFEQLYKRYFNKVYFQVKSYLKDAEASQDLTQDIFVKLHSRLAKFQQNSTFSTWLFSFARNAITDHLRKENKIRETDLEEARLMTDEEVDDKELLQIKSERLGKILERIPPDDKAVLIMMYAHGWQMDEISEVMNLSMSATKMRLKRAKLKVLALYEKMYGED